MVMFDSLNRHMLPAYGCDWVHAPNFRRLAEKTAVFTSSFVGSMPRMPARRELHTGRPNFLHRSWGPLEPFDDSMPELLQKHGVSTHLVSDHYHYWEDGGATYHSRYSTWDAFRGQEGDPCIGDLNTPGIPEPNPGTRGERGRQDWVNRSHMQDERNQPQPRTFAAGLAFLDRNHAHDNWFLHIETFDPHEPYFCNQNYKALYSYDFSRSPHDWPPYASAQENPNLRQLLDQYRYSNAALISMCDHYLGLALEAMDKYDLWKDTMLIVNTDHGFLLGEHDWWGKCRMPFYDEIAHTPLFIWDPRCGKRGERRKSLVQTIDLPATLLEYFGAPRPNDMQGVPLHDTIATDKPVRQAGLYGGHGGHVNVTDGRYTYMRAPTRPENGPLYNYTHMPTHMCGPFSVEEMRTAVMHPPFSFTKGCPVMRIDANPRSGANAHGFGTLLFDIESDPQQLHPLNASAIERMMIEHLVREMKANDAPAEQFERLGLKG